MNTVSVIANLLYFLNFKIQPKQTTMEHNILGWFEIPVRDMERAIGFYEGVFGFEMERHKMQELDMAWFPWKESAMGAPGSLVYNEKFYQPQENGVLIYLTTPSGDLNTDIEKIIQSGGKVIVPRTRISEEHGYMCVFLDSEGNRIALHSRT